MVLTMPVRHGAHDQLSRRGFLGVAAVAGAGILAPRASASGVVDRFLLGHEGDTPTGRHFASRPDLLPPPVSILVPDSGATKGHILLAPFSFPTTPPSTEASGPLIVDRNGQPLWFKPLTKVTAIDLRVQRYRGAPVLTWWEGTVFGGYGGTFVIADASYNEIARVRAGNGYKADLHEILITSRNTALISIYNEIRTDLSRVGGLVDGRLVEGIIQEIDIPSGRVLFEWHSLDHVALEESFELAVTPAGNVDYFHLNSIGVDTDGHLLVSARNTSAVYKVHRRTGAVIWRLGGTAKRLHARPRRLVRLPARRAAALGRDVDDLRQRCLPADAARRRLAAAPSPARHVGEDGHARARLPGAATCAPPGRWGTPSR